MRKLGIHFREILEKFFVNIEGIPETMEKFGKHFEVIL